MARIKMGPQGPYWDANDTGPDQVDATMASSMRAQGMNAGYPSEGTPPVMSAPPPGINRGYPSEGTPRIWPDQAPGMNAGYPSEGTPPIATGRMKLGPNGPYWDPNDTGPDQTAAQPTPMPAAASAGAAPTPGGTFSDPASASMEALINQRTQALNTPYQNPDFQPAIDQLRRYLTQLNGPAYTPQQADLQQTQALDPLERQRQAAKQQIVERLAARGMGAGSGLLERALEDVDRQFNQMRTTVQSGFANRAVDLQRQNQMTAAQLAPQIASLQQQQFGGNEARQMSAVQLSQIVPQIAWQRLMGAQQGAGLDPASLMSLAQAIQSAGAGQNAAYMQGLMPLLQVILGGSG